MLKIFSKEVINFTRIIVVNIPVIVDDIPDIVVDIPVIVVIFYFYIQQVQQLILSLF